MLSQRHPPISPQLTPGAVGPATTVASALPPLCAAVQHAGSRCSRVPHQPWCQTTCSVCKPARGTWTSPHGSCCLPIPNLCWLPLDAYQPSHSCRTQGAPKHSPLFLGVVSPAPPTTSGLGAGEQHGGHSGSRGLGTVAPLLAKSICPFCISAGCRHSVPAVSSVLAAGDGDGVGGSPLQGRFIWIFIV